MDEITRLQFGRIGGQVIQVERAIDLWKGIHVAVQIVLEKTPRKARILSEGDPCHNSTVGHRGRVDYGSSELQTHSLEDYKEFKGIAFSKGQIGDDPCPSRSDVCCFGRHQAIGLVVN